MKRALAILLLITAAVLLFPISACADTLTLPAGLREIGEEAFRGDTSLDTVLLPDGLSAIGPAAFAYSGVRQIVIPPSVTSIHDTAFEGCGSSLRAVVSYRSYACSWCAAKGLALSLDGGTIPTGSSTVTVPVPGVRMRYSFVPAASGSYTFRSTGSADPCAYLYDASGALLSYDDNSGDQNNFRLTANLTKGRTYFWELGFVSSTRTGAIPVSLDVTREPQYRALLISEVNFPIVCNRNEGDVQRMKQMLQSVKGPTGGSYSVTTGRDYSPIQVEYAIRNTFGAATEDDVSLFFIATHGDTSYGAGSMYAGQLSTVSGGPITFDSLATWLKAVPGKVIVIVESCGSGAAIYSNAAGAVSTAANDEAFSQALIDAFARADEAGTAEKKTGIVPNTGELRVSGKFYVLTASALQQDSWGAEGLSAANSFNYFTQWLVQGVGTAGALPADTQYAGNRDGVVSLEELYRYISAVGDNHAFPDTYGFAFQTVKRYPENSSYGLFIR